MILPGFDSCVHGKVSGVSVQVSGNCSIICHSVGATLGSLISEKKIFPKMLIETRATEESSDASRQG